MKTGIWRKITSKDYRNKAFESLFLEEKFIKELARELKIAIHTVQKYLNELVALGYIEKEKSKYCRGKRLSASKATNQALIDYLQERWGEITTTDKDIIKNNPKIFMGYSDTTTINSFINQLGIVTFNGPAVMAGFSQMQNFPEYKKNIKDILFDSKSSYEYKPYKEWSMKYLDWSKKENVGLIQKIEKNAGWNWIQGEGIAAGELFGGCIEILQMLNGTDYWPKINFWKDKILFIETSEDKPSPDYVKYALRNYGIQGIFDKIKAILVGRARDYSEEENKKLEKNIIEVVAKEFNHPEMPIITNMDFGHTDPQFILPLGVKAEISCINKTFKLIESACI